MARKKGQSAFDDVIDNDDAADDEDSDSPTTTTETQPETNATADTPTTTEQTQQAQTDTETTSPDTPPTDTSTPTDTDSNTPTDTDTTTNSQSTEATTQDTGTSPQDETADTSHDVSFTDSGQPVINPDELPDKATIPFKEDALVENHKQTLYAATECWNGYTNARFTAQAVLRLEYGLDNVSAFELNSAIGALVAQELSPADIAAQVLRHRGVDISTVTDKN